MVISRAVMIHRWAVMLTTLICLLITVPSVCGEESGQTDIIGSDISSQSVLSFVAADGNSTRYQTGPVTVLVLEGTYREMGQQYGRLMGAEIAAMYEAAIHALPRLSVLSGITTEEVLLERCMDQYRLYPHRYREIAEGMAETSGVPVSHIIAIDQFFPIAVMPPAEGAFQGGHCSALTVWGEYTPDGSLVMGRNFDFFNGYRDFTPYLMVLVYRPGDGSIPVATIGYAGSIGGLESFNGAGLVLETNDNSLVPWPDNTTWSDRIPFNLLVLEYLSDATTLDQLDATMKTIRPGYPMLFSVADPKAGWVYEGGTRDIIRRGDLHDGMQVITNLPVDPSWNTPVYDENLTSRSVVRRNNLLSLADQNKGRINRFVMRTIIDTPIEEGGAGVSFQPESDLSTIYRYVYEPGGQILSLRSPPDHPWILIPLSPLFSHGV